MKPPVYVSRCVPAGVQSRLDDLFELTIHDAELPPARDELLAAAAGSQGLVTMLTDRVDDELLAAAGPDLRIVAHYAAGFDTVDVEAATRRGVVVTNTPDVLTEATAEFTFALILGLTRRVVAGDRFLRRGGEWSWAPTFMLGSGLEGRTLGIVGLGRIGAAVARLGGAFGTRVVYTNESGPRPDVALDWLPLEHLLASSDVVTLHCPLTPETHHLIGRDALRAMRPEAFLVNTARGPLVDEAALAEAVQAGEIAGAALDVFEREPEVEPLLLELENVVLAPHLGSATVEARDAMGMLCVEALRTVLLEGRLPRHALNSDACAPA